MKSAFMQAALTGTSISMPGPYFPRPNGPGSYSLMPRKAAPSYEFPCIALPCLRSRAKGVETGAVPPPGKTQVIQERREAEPEMRGGY